MTDYSFIEGLVPVSDEYWASIEGLPLYSVSNYGRVCNNKTGRHLKVTTDKQGYLRVYLHRKGKRYRVYVHLLVALVYFDQYKPGVGVGFLNGNRSDCTVANLTLMRALSG